MVRTDRYGVVRVYMLLFPRKKHSGVCSENSDWRRWTESSPWVSVDHSKLMPINQSEFPYQSSWSVNDKDVLNCSSNVSDSLNYINSSKYMPMYIGSLPGVRDTIYTQGSFGEAIRPMCLRLLVIF